LEGVTELTVKYRSQDGALQIFDTADPKRLPRYKDQVFLKPQPQHFGKIRRLVYSSEIQILLMEKSHGLAVLTFHFVEKGEIFFGNIQQSSPSIRLDAFDLPPIEFTLIESRQAAIPIYRSLLENDADLFSKTAASFLNSSNILSQLLIHVSQISAKEHINFVDKVRVLSDYLRNWMSDSIVKLHKDHSAVWGHYFGERVSFVDGGVSRIISVPGIEPTGIRVGIYSVIPGEPDAEKREQWRRDAFVISDVLSDKSIIPKQAIHERNSKRIREAARYVLELLITHNFIERQKPSILLLHGPLQNAVETYTEMDPYYIPGVNKSVLRSYGITKSKVCDQIQNIPLDTDREPYWNSAICIYRYLLEKIMSSEIPVVGVVERSSSSVILEETLNRLVRNRKITDSNRRKFRRVISTFEIKDDFVFGCALESGEFISPIQIQKNYPNKARDRWQDFVAEFPKTYVTMLKTSDNSFPFRVELNKKFKDSELLSIFNLIFHTSLLLPKYAFPVGIDIVDKYAKIPDWLSKGVSEQLAAQMFRACIQNEDLEKLNQVRNLLARSPRDFFFRPKT
jgi:hypothetical protein